ncbi:unnamed protein product [Chrysoparadoxa australica]
MRRLFAAQVPPQKANELRLDPRVLKVVENRVVNSLSKDLLMEVLQTKYTVVNRDTGELYDVREVDGSAPYRYSVLPHNVHVPGKARRMLGINEQKTHVPPKAAKVMGHGGGTHLTNEEQVSEKASKVLGLVNATSHPNQRNRNSISGPGALSRLSDAQLQEEMSKRSPRRMSEPEWSPKKKIGTRLQVEQAQAAQVQEAQAESEAEQLDVAGLSLSEPTEYLEDADERLLFDSLDEARAAEAAQAAAAD